VKAFLAASLINNNCLILTILVQGENDLFGELGPLTHRRKTVSDHLRSVLLPQESLEEEVSVPKLDLGLTKSRLFLDCVSASDAGTYTCVAESITRKISTDFELSVGKGPCNCAMGSGHWRRLVKNILGKPKYWGGKGGNNLGKGARA